MANTVTLLSYANTFGDWVVTTNKLAQENNDFAANNFVKPTGTLFLSSPSLGLQVANNAVIQGQLQVSGVGSSVYIQKNMQIDGQIIGASNNYFIANDSNNIFNITQSGSGLALRINSQPGGSGTAGQNTTVIDANGNVYIGSASAGTFKLNVANGNVNFAQNLTVGSNITSQIVRTTNHVVSKDVTASANVLGDRIQANTNLISPTLAVSGVAYINYVQANTAVNTAIATVDTIYAAIHINSPTITATNNIIGDVVSGNTRVVSPSILGTTSVVGGVIFANTHISSNTVTGSNNVIGNIVSGNTRVISPTVIGISSVTGNLITANSTVVTPLLTVTTRIDANTAEIYARDVIANTISVQGNFVVSGDTVYNSDILTINADAAVPTTGTFASSRGSGNANAEIRWNELQDYWDIRDVNNPSSYSKILTANLISDSTVLVSSDNLASSRSVNYLQNVANTQNSAISAGNTFARMASFTANAAWIGANTANTNVASVNTFANMVAFTANQAWIGANTANGNISALQAQMTTTNTNIASTNTFASAAFNRANTGAFVGTTGTATASIGVISFSSNNGVTVYGSSNVLNISTSQDLRTTASPTFAGLTLSSPLGLSQGGTGATSASSALTNILPTGTTAGYVLTTGGPGNFYWSASGGGGGGATPGTTINSTRLSYTASGTQVTYTTPTFSTATQLRAYINGVRQFESEYTANISNSTISFTVAPSLNDAILIEIDGFIDNPYYANNIAYTINADISSTANTIQLAIDGLTSKLTTYYANTNGGTQTFTNVVLAPTPTINSSTGNTQVATTAFVNNKANSGVTFSHSITGSAGSVANTGIIGAVGPTITDDTTNSGARYVTFTTQTSGTQTIANVSSSKLTFEPSTGTLSATVMTSTSDENLKENIVEISNALNTVMRLKGVEYNWKDTGEKGMGLIAQDVEKIIPYLIAENENGKSVMYQNMIGLLVQAIKELKQEIDRLKGDNK